jgi:hypothetical protein
MPETRGDMMAEWRGRMVHALAAALTAMDARAPSAEIVMRHERIRVLEHEGRARGFLPAEGAQE